MKSASAALAICFAICLAPTMNAQEAPAAMPDTETAAKTLTIESLFASPSLSGPTPRSVKFSPDGQQVTFLKPREDDATRLDLWAFDVETGEAFELVNSAVVDPEEAELSEEEKALRERKRIASLRGIVDYQWDAKGRFILVPAGGDIWLVDVTAEGTPARKITETDAFEYDAKVSPGGRYVSFIRDGALYAVEIESGEEMRLSPEAEPDKAIRYGVAEFVAQEEMSRYTGYWWSPDDKYVAYTRVDESTVDIIPRFDIAAEEVTVIEQRYPRAGRPNAVVDLFVREMATGDETKAFTVGPDNYFAELQWLDESALVAMRVDRDQTEITHTLFTIGQPAADLDTLAERQANWINLSHQPLRLLKGADEGDQKLFFVSERSGNRHIWMIGSEGPAQAVTAGDWAVAEFLRVDEGNGAVYFTGYLDTPLEKHLYRYGRGEAFEPDEPVLLTEPGSSWSITMAPDGKSFIGTSSSPTQPPQTGLYRITDEGGTERITWIEENALGPDHPYFPYLDSHTVPEYGTLSAEDGQTLYYSIQTPPDFDPAKQYPVIIEVYGGPGVQTVNRNWERLSDVFYTQQGYIVFRLDNRGSANRGKAFEDVIYRQMGIPEVRDQLLGVAWLKAQPFVDADRIAIQGWSYGGYMTLMTILQAPEGTFAAAVSGAPVTDWALYDTFYTERYMDTPEDNSEGYERSSVFYWLDKLEGRMPPLLLIHGMADDNVTFDNSTRLMAELQKRAIPFDLMTYPGQRHGVRGDGISEHLMLTRMAFLDRHLKGD